MMRRCLYFILIISANAWATPEGRVSLSIDPDKTYWVGQRVLVHLDLKTNGFSFSGQRFSFPQINGGVLLQTDSSTLKLTEQIDGESWQVLRYDLSLFSQRPGEVEIPSFAVHFNASLGYGQPEAGFDLKTQALSVALKLPPGADPSQPVVTTPRLKVQEQWQPPDQTEFKIGEALTRTITLEAEDVSGIALPAGPDQAIEGIDQLPKAPLVEDKSDRGTLNGYRREQVSYLFNREGDYTLPSGSISWWNPKTKKLEQHQFEAKSISVKQDPLAKVSNASGGRLAEAHRLSSVLLWFFLLLMSGILLYWQWPRIRAKRVMHFNAEPAQFKRAIRACRKNDAKMAWSMSNAWLISTGLSISPQDKVVWQQLQRAMLSNADKWSGKALKNSLLNVRKKAQSEAKKTLYLKPLNP